MSNSADARHVCRTCGFVIEPQPNAHTKMAQHTLQAHNFKLPKTCKAECGFRARPFEGRYAPTN